MLHYKTIVNNQFDRWVVMIHGAGGSIEVWYRQVADFARHFNILLVDNKSFFNRHTLDFICNI